MSAPNYEFTDSENREVQALADGLRRFSLPLSVFAATQLGAAGWLQSLNQPQWTPLFTLVAVLCSAVSVIIVVLARRAADDFQRIVDTEGSDIDHLMTAFARITRSVYLCLPVAALTFLGLFAQLFKTVLKT